MTGRPASPPSLTVGTKGTLPAGQLVLQTKIHPRPTEDGQTEIQCGFLKAGWTAEQLVRCRT